MNAKVSFLKVAFLVSLLLPPPVLSEMHENYDGGGEWKHYGSFNFLKVKSLRRTRAERKT